MWKQGGGIVKDRLVVAQRVKAHIFKRWVTFSSDRDDLERLRYIARRRNLDERTVLREALAEGAKIQDVTALEDRLLRLRQERDQLLGKRDKLAETFAKLSLTDSTLRYRYYELYSQNKSLTVNLCGLGLGKKFPELLDRYLFANNDRQKASSSLRNHSLNTSDRTQSGPRT
jgi:hypothetical protein